MLPIMITKIPFCWSMYHLVMICIDLSETAHFAHWKSEITSKTIFFLTIFFPTKKYFSQIFSQTEFCLGLDFVADYTPQLYFVCNHLICWFTLTSDLILPDAIATTTEKIIILKHA